MRGGHAQALALPKRVAKSALVPAYDVAVRVEDVARGGRVP